MISPFSVDVDVWNSTSGLCNILKDIDTSHVKLYSERKEGQCTFESMVVLWNLS